MPETKRITIAVPTAILSGHDETYGTIYQGYHCAIRSMIITGDNMIIYRRRTNFEYTAGKTFPMYQYYLLGRNVTIEESKIGNWKDTRSWISLEQGFVGFYSNLMNGLGNMQDTIMSLTEIQLISPTMFTQAYHDTSLTVEDTHPSSINTQTRISLELPRDYQLEISPTFNPSTNKGCVYGYSNNLFESTTNANLNSIPFASTFAYFNGTANVAGHESSSNAITLEEFDRPFYKRGFTNAGYPAAYGNIINHKGEILVKKNPHYDFGHSPDKNTVDMWDVWYETFEPIATLEEDYYDYLGATWQNAQGLPGTPNPWYNINRYRWTLQASYEHGWGSVFPRTETINNWIPFENVYITNILISENIDEIEDYIRTGNIPSDAFENEVDDDGVPKKFSDDPDDQDDEPENENGSKTVIIDKMDDPTPTKGAITSGCNGYFLINERSMRAFLHWFWYDNDDWTLAINNWITGMYGNLKECIVSYMCLHCPTGALGEISENPENVVIGKLDTNIELYKLIGIGASQLAGEIDISKAYDHYNTFVDYEGYTNFQLYLPFVGFITLPTNTVQNRILRVYYAVDAPTGQMIYKVKVAEPDNPDNDFIVFETTTQVGEEIPISLVDSLENTTRLIDVAFKTTTSLISIGGNLAAGNTVGAALSTATVSSNITGSTNNFSNTSTHLSGNLSNSANINVNPTQALRELSQYKSDTPTSIGQVNNVSGKWSSLYCYLLVDYPVVNNKSGGYNHHIGYLLNKPYKLSSLSGFTTCIKPQINFTRTAPLLKEIEEIYQLLESGIIL